MSPIVTISVFIVLLVIAWRNPQRGLLLCIVLGLTFPLTKLGSMSLAFDYLVFIVLCVIYYRIPAKGKNRYNKYLVIYFLLLLFSTLSSTCLIQSSVLQMIAIIGTIKYLIIYKLITELQFNPKVFENALILTLIINIVVVLLQIITPNAAEWTYAFYSKGEGSALEGLESTGIIRRTYGTFANSAPFGFFITLASTVLFKSYYTTGKTIYLVLILGAAIAGLFSTSKLFILMFPVVLITFLLFNGYIVHISTNSTSIYAIIVVAIGLLLGGYIVVNYLINDVFSAQFEYVFERLLAGGISSSFESRYEEEGAVVDMLRVFYEYPIFGVGSTVVNGEFLGDSSWVLILHHTGLLGTFIISIFYFRQILTALRLKNRYAIMLVIMFIASGMVTNLLFAFAPMIYFSYLHSLLTNQNS